MFKLILLVNLLLLNAPNVNAFAPKAFPLMSSSASSSFATRTTTLASTFDDDNDDAGVGVGDDEEEDFPKPKMNPNNPNLPELEGDFDWDAKFGGDDDWITENVPGKIVLNEIELAQQVTALNQLEEKWRKVRARDSYEESRSVGFVEKAELLNGRTAMFFLVTGLLTEYWTGVSLPGQVEEMLRVGGFIGFE